MTIRGGTWQLKHDGFIIHTKIRNLHEVLKAKLEKLTIDPKHDSFMYGLLQDVYTNTKRTARTDVFILFDPRIPDKINEDRSIEPVAWAVVHEAHWIAPERERYSRCNEVSIFVDPEHRGKHYSTRLLGYTKERLAHTHRRWVGVPDDDAGRAAFKKLRITDVSDWITLHCLDEIDALFPEDDGYEMVEMHCES